jgi:ABC-type lipoprotein export system ATPase subunit
MSKDTAELIELPSRDSQKAAAGGTASGASGRPSPEPARSTLPANRPLGAGPMIVCDNLVKIYKVADLEVVALQGLDLLIEPGELIALVGASGSGKSTLMNILGGLDVPSAGRAVVAGHILGDMGRRERSEYRRRVIGFVWQQTARNLLRYLTARQNVELPMLLNGVGRSEREDRAAQLRARVGLAERGDHRPERLSGGEQQRVAIARAFANSPRILFADEPTGNLDSETSEKVIEIMLELNRDAGTALVLVTHDPDVARPTERTIRLRNGEMVE